MNSSVKFLEPTVMLTLPFAELLLISFPPPLVVLELLSPPPHAATSTAHASAANGAVRARAAFRLISGDSWFLGARTRADYPLRAQAASLRPLGDTMRCSVANTSSTA